MVDDKKFIRRKKSKSPWKLKKNNELFILLRNKQHAEGP